MPWSYIGFSDLCEAEKGGSQKQKVVNPNFKTKTLETEAMNPVMQMEKGLQKKEAMNPANPPKP